MAGVGYKEEIVTCSNLALFFYLIALNKVAKVLFFRFSFFFRVFSSIVAARSHACSTVIAWQ